MVKKLLQLFIMVLIIGCFLPIQAQSFGIKTNLLYWGSATPNLGAELALSKNTTMDIQLGYNPWNLDGSETNNKKIAHWLIQPEYRYWFCEKFMGHFIGVHPFFAKYNIGGYKIPLLLESNSDQYRYKGYMGGIGIAYGYQWMLSKHFSMEFIVGIGYARMNYDKYDCMRCGDKLSNENRNYMGPTRAGISLIYVFTK